MFLDESCGVNREVWGGWACDFDGDWRWAKGFGGRAVLNGDPKAMLLCQPEIETN